MLTNRSPGLVRQLYSAIVLILSTFFTAHTHRFSAVVFVVVVVVAFSVSLSNMTIPYTTIPFRSTDPAMNESFFWRDKIANLNIYLRDTVKRTSACVLFFFRFSM